MAEQLDRIHQLAQDALAESRSLITHLRPKPVAEQGLINALFNPAFDVLPEGFSSFGEMGETW